MLYPLSYEGRGTRAEGGGWRLPGENLVERCGRAGGGGEAVDPERVAEEVEGLALVLGASRDAIGEH
jgi:hypothetical protein